uniref:Uncharacterized protein n=1 Tax=Heterorhabditis bacteriophora TaxID=37862 RepID=A0A1I7W7Z5_HETBA
MLHILQKKKIFTCHIIYKLNIINLFYCLNCGHINALRTICGVLGLFFLINEQYYVLNNLVREGYNPICHHFFLIVYHCLNLDFFPIPLELSMHAQCRLRDADLSKTVSQKMPLSEHSLRRILEVPKYWTVDVKLSRTYSKFERGLTSIVFLMVYRIFRELMSTAGICRIVETKSWKSV